MASVQQVRRERLALFIQEGERNTNRLSRLTGLSPRSVRRIKKILGSVGSVARKPGSGSQRRLGANDRRRLAQLAVRNDRLSNRRLATKMQDKGSPLVSPSTISRELKRMGFKRRTARSRPLLTQRHKDARLAWCLENKNRDFDNVIFTDESKFQYYSNSRKRLCKKQQDFP